MNRDMSGKVLLQAIFQIGQGGRAESFGSSSTPRAAQLSEPARHHSLGCPDGGALPQNGFGNQALFVMRLQPEQDLGVADGKQALHDPSLNLLIEVEQPHRICDRSAALSDFLRDIVLAHAEFAGKAGVGLRFLDWVKVGAL
jgi:hypothetical protein